MENQIRCYDDIAAEVYDTENVITDTSSDQIDVETMILKIYQKFEKKASIDPDLPILNKNVHSKLLKNCLVNLPRNYECLDASRPWLVYWILNALWILKDMPDAETLSDVVQFLSHCQHEKGGFGGGPGQHPHLGTTYAAVNALSIIGTDEAYDSIDRSSLQKFLWTVRDVDGSFALHKGGEQDIRGAYCAASVAKLTNTYTDGLFDKTAEWIVSCQTYEGGFGGCPGMEAHGGYAFCGIAALALLNRTRLCDIDALLRWCVNRQMRVEGGFQGRTNKLVDGCYSFWQGAAFPIISAILSQENKELMETVLFNQGALQEYIIICCQAPDGGLIDKPGNPRDIYHTCYTLSGLSVAQHGTGVNDPYIDIREYDTEFEQDVCNDPFTKHLQYDLGDDLVVSLSNTQPNVENINKTWPILGNLFISIPKPVETLLKKVKAKVSILEENIYTSTGTVPQILNKLNFNQLHLKSQIHGHIVSANKTILIKRDLELSEVFTPLQMELFSIINNYQDLYYPERTFINADEIRYIYCLHIINHMLKTKTKILHHNAKLSKKSDSSDDYRDQGLVRPKVLVMVPFKDAAYRVVKTLIEILVPKEAGQVINKNRFEEDFTGGEIQLPRKNPKPEDYELLFSGNTDDTFRLGMSVTKKTLKLYTDFYSSDIIVASPLGLRIIVGAEGEEDRDFDFLASIELLIMDQADVFLMQNWDHLLHVLEHCHLQPKKTHGTDFSRVRSWAVNGWSKYYRQTLVFSSVPLPEIKSVLNKKCQNYAGKVFVVNPVESGSVKQVVLQVPQVFHRFNATNPLSSVESRFEYFVKEILPKQRDTLMSHTLIYVPSYFDYVRIRNFFKKEDIGFVQICEYSKDSKIARARDMFFHTEAHFLLYSERVHFFRRFRIKGIRHIIFYQPPTYPHFYSEICNLMQESNQNKYGGSEFNMTVTMLYSKYDLQQLAGVLGTDRVSRMIHSDESVHMYMTGD